MTNGFSLSPAGYLIAALLVVSVVSGGLASIYRSRCLPRLWKMLSSRFSDFLAADGRFDLWVHSATDHATLVWDRHDQLFGYGPVDLFVSRFREVGFVAGRVEVPGQHEHHYRAEMDVHAADLLAAFDWRHSPLRPEDEQ